MRSIAVVLAVIIGGFLVAKYYPTSFGAYAVAAAGTLIYSGLERLGCLSGVGRWLLSNPTRAQIIVGLVLLLLVVMVGPRSIKTRR